MLVRNLFTVVATEMANGESVGHVVRENFVYRMRENERHNFGVNYAFL